MKKIIVLFMGIFLLLPCFLFAKTKTYCGYNSYGNYYCSYSDGSYEYWNKQEKGNPYYGLPHYYYDASKSYSKTNNYYNILSQDEKCNLKYPGTVYRYSDSRCACPGDKKGTSSWSSIYGCSKQIKVSALSTKDIQCNAKYPGTVYRSTDDWCACPGDRVGTSSWKKSTRSC